MSNPVPVPRGVAARTAESETQKVEGAPVLPSVTDGDKSTVPKFCPRTVIVSPPVVPPLTSLALKTSGGS
eukprot:525112-Rhodomonas_salina.1